MSVKKISQLNPLTSNEVTSSIDLLAIVDTTNTETKKITVDNLLSGGNYSVSGSFSGSFQGDGSGITGVTGEWDGSHNGNASITGSLTVTGIISSSSNLFGDRIIAASYIQTPVVNSATNVVRIDDSLNVVGQITASGDISSSADVYGVTGSFLHLLGDGSQLTGVESEWDGTLNGNGEITGSLVVTGDITGSNISASSLLVTGDITGSNISASNTVYGITGSFSHLQGNSPFTVGDQVNFQQPITSSGTLNTTSNIIKKSGNSTSTYNPNFGALTTTTATTTSFNPFLLQQDKVTTLRFKVGCKEVSTPSVGGYWEFLTTYTNEGGSPVQLGSKVDFVSHVSTAGGLSTTVLLSSTGTGVGQQQVTVRVTTTTATNKTWYATVEEIIMVN